MTDYSETILLRRASRQPAPPCEVFACKYCNICQDREMACYSFSRYLTTGEARSPSIPSRTIYNKIFANDE